MTRTMTLTTLMAALAGSTLLAATPVAVAVDAAALVRRRALGDGRPAPVEGVVGRLADEGGVELDVRVAVGELEPALLPQRAAAVGYSKPIELHP